MKDVVHLAWEYACSAGNCNILGAQKLMVKKPAQPLLGLTNPKKSPTSKYP